MRVAVAERSRAQSSLDRRRVCIVESWRSFYPCASIRRGFSFASPLPFSSLFPRPLPPFSPSTEALYRFRFVSFLFILNKTCTLFLVHGQGTESGDFYVTCARKLLVAQRVGPVVKYGEEER